MLNKSINPYIASNIYDIYNKEQIKVFKGNQGKI